MTILQDAISNPELLTKERVHSWHAALFPTGQSGLTRIKTGTYRTDEMEVVSNPYGRKKVHYIAPPSNLIHNRTYDFTEWFTWHLEIHAKAIENSICQTETIIKKAKLWDKINTASLNERQKKVLNKLANIGEDNFVGGLSTKKYQAIAKTSRATAIRDINDLISKGFLKQVEGTAGRSIRYRFALL